MILWCAMLHVAAGEIFSPAPLSKAEKVALYQQARVTPGARQIGVSCAFYANVPLVTMLSGVNIADGSPASKDFVASIYGLRKGEFSFLSAFDREMFFKLFHISSKGVKVYYREAPRGELLADAEALVTHHLANALDDGQFVSLRILGDFGGPHNVLLLARRAGTFYYHDPRSGRIVASPSAVLASKILTVSKARSKTAKRYFSSYHLVAIPPPLEINEAFQTPAEFPKSMEIALTEDQKIKIAGFLTRESDMKGVAASFPGVDFATKGKNSESVIEKDLSGIRLIGVYNLTKLGLNSYHTGRRMLLPVWLLDGTPVVVTGYTNEDKAGITVFDGARSRSISLDLALKQFERSGNFFGYVGFEK